MFRDLLWDSSSDASFPVIKNDAEELKRWPMSRTQITRDGDIAGDECTQDQLRGVCCLSKAAAINEFALQPLSLSLSRHYTTAPLCNVAVLTLPTALP